MEVKFNKNCIYITGKIENNTDIDKIIEKIKILNSNNEKIIIALNSKGGSLNAAFKIIHALKQVNNEIITVASYECSSAASLIFLMGDRKFIFNETEVLIHSPTCRFNNNETYHKRKMHYKNLRQKLISIYRRNTLLPKNLVKQLCYDFDGKMFGPDEIIKYKIADKKIKYWEEVLKND